MELFDLLPVAAIVNGKYLSLHGGICPQLSSLQKLNEFNRRGEPMSEGMLSDLLWADPADEDEKDEFEFWNNRSRGTSYIFGQEPLKKLLKQSNLQALIRAHEAKPDGYEFHMPRSDGQPLCITVFSAPNYCGSYGNRAAVFCTAADR